MLMLWKFVDESQDGKMCVLILNSLHGEISEMKFNIIN